MMLGDDQWEELEPLLPGRVGTPGASARNNRQFIEAMLWFTSEVRAWRDLPLVYGKWGTVYMRFIRWHGSGIWVELARQVRGDPVLHAGMARIAAYGKQHQRRIMETYHRRAHRGGIDPRLQNKCLIHARGAYWMMAQPNIGYGW